MASFSNDNRLILNYHDAILYESDLQILSSPTAWLNDACIHFGMTRLAQKHLHEKMIFMDPSVVSFFMHQCIDEKEIQEFIDGNPELQSCSLIFIPINNGHDGASSTKWHVTSGTHWNLLVMVQREDSKRDYFYFDSVQGSNVRAAQAVANKFHQVLSCPESSSLSTTVTLMECKTPQQENGYDCGLHVLAETEYLASLGGGGGDIDANSLALVQLRDMLELRKTLATEATQLAKEYAEAVNATD